MNEQYSTIAGVYDGLNTGCDYNLLCSYLTKEIRENEKSKASLLLDLACGTGKLTLLMREMGFDMTGIDLSEDMLAVARESCYDKGINDVLWLCQDMTDFELYGTVDACVCTLDGLNYLTFEGELEQTFSCVHNYLIPDGLFIFDMTTKYKFENIYASNSYLYEGESESGEYFCAWQNMYDRESEVCEFALTTFVKNQNGSYRRADEVQYQRMYEAHHVKALLTKCGFEVLAVTGGLEFSSLKDDDERMFFVAKCKK